MILWGNGIVLPEGRIALDITRRQPCGFISHAHSDHLARHELTYCTAETESLARHRLKSKPLQQFRTLRYFEPVTFGGLELTAYPAGHCLGSAMLFARSLSTGTTLLYTGDFKLGPSATSIEAVVPKADLLIIESTFGCPELRLPHRDKVVAHLLAEVRRAFEDELTPVVCAYALGKSQEVTKILTDAGFRVAQHGAIYEISQIYEKHGVSLGAYEVMNSAARHANDCVLIAPPNAQIFRTGRPTRSILVSGWAISPRATRQFDVAVPLSDHADFDDLLQAVALCDASTVYCTHGAPEFVDQLRDRGIDARFPDRAHQQRLF